MDSLGTERTARTNLRHINALWQLVIILPEIRNGLTLDPQRGWGWCLSFFHSLGKYNWGIFLLQLGAELPEEPVSLKEVSEEVCEILSDAAGLKDVSLEVTGDTGLIMGARKLLYEIVYNLCDNAIKYNVLGGKVKISVSEEPGKVCLAVQDTGIGIAPEEHSKIFERFYRVDKSHSKQSGGTGLGLSIVKHAAQYHQADISVESEIDKGTTVLVVFKRL